ADLRSRLMTAAAEMPATPERRTDAATALRLTPQQKRGSRERRAAALLGGFAVVAASGSMAVASQSALPGDALYPVKRAIENAHANLESSPQAKASVLLDNAATRLSEVEELSARNDADPSEISSTLQSFKDQSSQAGAVALDAFKSDGSGDALTELRSFASSSMGRLSALDDVLPVEARPALVAAAQTVQSIDQAAYDACPTCTDGLVTQLPSFATLPLSAHLKLPLATDHQQGKSSSGTPQHSSTTPTDRGTPSAKPSSDATGLPAVLPSDLSSSLPTTSSPTGGIIPNTLNQITKDLLGGTSTGTGGTSTGTSGTTSGATSGTKDSNTPVVDGVTGLLGLN
ncbi:MAG TPA: DUF5667 domain-containing protein, partial [Nocardioides sp.]|nr:DUF5667 domain-containing protein [Nocardioides sp.]